MATALIPAWIDQAADRDAEPIGERFPPVLQRTWELATLFLLYMERRPGRVLEIGTYHGGNIGALVAIWPNRRGRCVGR